MIGIATKLNLVRLGDRTDDNIIFLLVDHIDNLCICVCLYLTTVYVLMLHYCLFMLLWLHTWLTKLLDVSIMMVILREYYQEF